LEIDSLNIDMSIPPPMAAPIVGSLNPIEIVLTGINTNTYLIGMSMILLNLGGRHLAPSLTAEQDKFFQNPWIRRAMLLVVIFVATRNIFTAFWLSIGLILVIGYLFNEHSSLYLFGEPVPLPPPPMVTPSNGLTPEEQDIYRKLQDKVNRTTENKETEEKKKTMKEQMTSGYKENMTALRTVIS
jgi:hypothetical protein